MLLLHGVSENKPTLVSCSFNKHGLILIILGKHRRNYSKANKVSKSEGRGTWGKMTNGARWRSAASLCPWSNITYLYGQQWSSLPAASLCLWRVHVPYFNSYSFMVMILVLTATSRR